MIVVMSNTFPIKLPELSDTHQHHFEERAVFVGCGVRAVKVNVVSECELKVNL